MSYTSPVPLLPVIKQALLISGIIQNLFIRGENGVGVHTLKKSPSCKLLSALNNNALSFTIVYYLYPYCVKAEDWILLPSSAKCRDFLQRKDHFGLLGGSALS